MNVSDIIVDPELEALLPPLSKDERAELASSVQRDGYTDPIIVWLGHGILVDGHNRLRIWNDDGADEDRAPTILEKTFTDRDAVKEWMLRRQLARRNLTDAMRVQVALRLRPVLESKAKANKVASGGDKKTAGSVLQLVGEPIRVDKEIAKAAGVSHETVRRVETVLEQASEEVKQEMLSGTKSITAAFKMTKAAEPKPAAAPEPLGVGVEFAHEAIACLKRIPVGDALRGRALQIVGDWIKQNR